MLDLRVLHKLKKDKTVMIGNSRCCIEFKRSRVPIFQMKELVGGGSFPELANCGGEREADKIITFFKPIVSQQSGDVSTGFLKSSCVS